MLQRKIKWFGVATLACAAALCAGFGAANVTADAASTMDGFEILYTSVRIGNATTDNPSGLRFKVDLPENVAKADVTNAYTKVSFTAADGEAYSTNVEATVWRSEGDGWNTVLLDIPDTDYKTQITAQAFMTVKGVEYETEVKTSSISTTARKAVEKGIDTWENVGGFIKAEEVTETVVFKDVVEIAENAKDFASYEMGGVTITAGAGSNTSSKPKYYDTGTGVRLYGGNTMTFTVNEHFYIDKIVFRTSTGSNAVNEASVSSVGTLNINGGTTTISNIATNTVTLTQGGTSGHVRIQKVEVTYVSGTLSDEDKAKNEATKLAEEALEAEMGALTVAEKIAEAGTVTLPTATQQGVTVTWALNDADAVKDNATLNGNALTISLPAMGAEDVKISLTATVTATATATVGDATATGTAGDTKEFPVTIVAPKDDTQPEQPAEPITVSKTVASLITEYGWTSSTTKQSFTLDDVVSVKVNGGSNTGKAYDGNNIRIYATDTPAGTLTISVAEGYELVSIKITTQTGTYAFLYVEGTTTDICNVTTAVSGSSVVLQSVKNGSDGKQVRITAIEVTYKNK